MDEVIKTLCQSIIEEAKSVIANTDRAVKAFEDVQTGDCSIETYRAFGINRLDGIEHIQNLTIALTKTVTDAQDKADITGGDDVE